MIIILFFFLFLVCSRNSCTVSVLNNDHYYVQSVGMGVGGREGRMPVLFDLGFNALGRLIIAQLCI